MYIPEAQIQLIPQNNILDEQQIEGQIQPPLCKICHDIAGEHGFIQPCLCNGSIKWVHRTCLDNWRLTNEVRQFQCEACLFHYQRLESDHLERRSCLKIMIYVLFDILYHLFLLESMILICLWIILGSGLTFQGLVGLVPIVDIQQLADKLQFYDNIMICHIITAFLQGAREILKWCFQKRFFVIFLPFALIPIENNHKEGFIYISSWLVFTFILAWGFVSCCYVLLNGTVKLIEKHEQDRTTLPVLWAVRDQNVLVQV